MSLNHKDKQKIFEPGEPFKALA